LFATLSRLRRNRVADWR